MHCVSDIQLRTTNARGVSIVTELDYGLRIQSYKLWLNLDKGFLGAPSAVCIGVNCEKATVVPMWYLCVPWLSGHVPSSPAAPACHCTWLTEAWAGGEPERETGREPEREGGDYNG